MGRLAHGLPQCIQVGAAEQGEAKTTASFTRCGGPATDVPPSEPKVNDWRDGRAATGSSGIRLLVFRRPGFGRGGWPG